jgi:hypothetical protein
MDLGAFFRSINFSPKETAVQDSGLPKLRVTLSSGLTYWICSVGEACTSRQAIA